MRSKLHSMLAVAALASLAGAAPAAAWEVVKLLNPLGDRGTGIVQPATNEPGIALAFGCEGDRWRQIVLLPHGQKPLRLAGGGDVRFGFSPTQLSPKGAWKVRPFGDGLRAYFAPAASTIIQRLVQEEGKDPNTVFYLQAQPSKKSPVVFQFPLAGLRAAIRKHLWEECKLDIYVGDGK